ncbi:MAG: wax ester/triacylglycerol synthase family O-acyltransferase [Actinobacteria bacterium]|nr:wax ester/triacylglycerol synthase family O-acyltransferase [Actinomycetota bacterium]
MSVPVASGDLTWLLMDRPNNLMYVHGVLWFDRTPDWDEVEQVVAERLVGRFPVFGRRAAEVDGTWIWQDDDEFDLGNHVRRVTLDPPGTIEQAQDYISSRFSEPFDHSRPLWEMDFIEGVGGLVADGEGAMVLARFHHGIADGVRLVQVLLSLLDPMDQGATPAAVGRSGGRGGMLGQVQRSVGHVVGGTADFVAGIGAAATRAPGKIANEAGRLAATGSKLVREPTRLVDAVTSVAGEENKWINTWRSLGRLALSGRSVETVWSGTPDVAKRVAWISGLQLDEVRRIGKAHGATINDVLLGAVSLGVSDYLADRGEREVDQLNWLIPVSLKPIDAELPAELGNHFALVMMPMPLGIEDPDELLAEIRSRMTRIKNSAEPAVLYGIQRIIAETPAAVSVPLTNYVANKAVGILTNVPGPRVPMALAGTEVAGILGWVPSSGDQPLGLCIFSYNGKVNIGIAADAGLVPDPERLGQYIESAVHRLSRDS